MSIVTDAMLVERCDTEAAAAGLKAASLRGGELAVFAVLFDNAERFWLDLGSAVALHKPLTKEQAFVANYCNKDMSSDARLWNTPKRGKRPAVAA